MKVSFKQFGCLSHSWSQVSTSIARSFKKQNIDIHYCSTNGYEYFPEDMMENIKCKECFTNGPKLDGCKLDRDYDLGMAYTIPLHWGEYTFAAKKKFVIYNYDGDVLPAGWSKFHNQVNLILPSSEYSRNTFIKAGIPESKLITVSHGYDDEFINRKEVYKIKSDKKYKVLVNIQQPHLRKNIIGLLKAWFEAFDDKDDICLVAKVRPRKESHINELSFMDELNKLKKNKKNHAEIVVINEFIPYISDLYRAIDVCFSLSHIECFHLPSLQALVSEKINICSAKGGNADFCNENNSLMVSGEIKRAPKEMFYWQPSIYGTAFYPNINEAAEKLIYAYKNYNQLKQQFKSGFDHIKENYSWDKIGNKILSLYNEYGI